MAPNMLSDMIGSYLMQTATLVAASTPPERHNLSEFDTDTPHQFTLNRNDDGAQTLKAIRQDTAKYQIYFSGNVQDALNPTLVQRIIQAKPNKNHTFWDYPGATRYVGVNRFDPLCKAGYQQIKQLIQQGVRPEDITIYGYSMGGGIAAYITRRLHDKGYPVNLIIDRSFSRLSAVVSPLVYHILTETPPYNEQYKRRLPFGTSLAASSITGLSIGTALAGLIASIGVIIASLIASIGYYLGIYLSRFSALNTFAHHLNTGLNTVALALHSAFYGLASVVGGLVGVAGFITGACIGVCIGAISSFQLLFTDTPYNLPLGLPTRLLLNTTTGEMTSVKNIQSILNQEKHGKIKIINSKQDKVVLEEAALNTGLGFTTDKKRTITHPKINSFWYHTDLHYGPLHDENIDHALTHLAPAAA